MREIKFRAWNGKEYESSDMAMAFNGICMREENPTSNSGYVRENGVDYYSDWATYKRKDWVVEQFTGLHDKNGNEIYEGDKVRSTHFVDGDGVTHYIEREIKWNNRLSGWSVCQIDTSSEERIKGNVQLWVFSRNMDIEVIGNIHTGATNAKTTD